MIQSSNSWSLDDALVLSCDEMLTQWRKQNGIFLYDRAEVASISTILWISKHPHSSQSDVLGWTTRSANTVMRHRPVTSPANLTQRRRMEPHMALITPDEMKIIYKEYEYKGDKDFMLGVDSGGPLYIYHPKIWQDIQQNRWIVVAEDGPSDCPLQVVEKHQISRTRRWLVPGTGSFSTLKEAADHACELLEQAHKRWQGRFTLDEQLAVIGGMYEQIISLPDYPKDKLG